MRIDSTRTTGRRGTVLVISCALLGSLGLAWACTPRAPAPPPRTAVPAVVEGAMAAPPLPQPPLPVRKPPQPEAEPEPSVDLAVVERFEMSSTAYCLKGKTRTGVRTREGLAAADPKVLPLGSVVRVSRSGGERVGVFVIMDTGGAVKGKKIDLYMDSCPAARRWGRKPVVVELLSTGF